MASRRIRIKGIANIPQRRKTASNQEQPQEEQSLKTEDETHNLILTESGVGCPTQRNDSEDVSNIVGDQNTTNEDVTAVATAAAAVDLKSNDEHNLTLIDNERTMKKNEVVPQAVCLPHKKDDASNNEVKSEANMINLISKPLLETEIPQLIPKENDKIEDFLAQKKETISFDGAKRAEDTINTTSTILADAILDKSPTAPNKPVFKRQLIKPIISSNVLQKRGKIKSDDEKPVELQPEPPVTVEAKKDTTKSVHFLLDEKEKETPTVDHIQTRETNEVPYPPAPLSPSKINRGRIKVAPRLGQRKTSFSASESEDDNRKSNRHRNDSVCSATSGVADQSYSLECPHSPKKEFANVVQRKFRRTEQSRKLAEARREFLQKFGTSKPDRQKLTMKDLIFYNPTTNPMSQKQKGTANSTEDVIEEQENDQPEEVVETDEESNALPAPQIKIGPDGEITIDEKSLVIENKQVKKSQEKIQKSKVVDGDTVSTYGIYKKTKRTKLWGKKETLRFYKALNAIGTDFSLMLSLFPDRTRRDLTMKFKKEEKINRALIDRALMVPNTYDITELKSEMELEEREEREKERVKREVDELAKRKTEENRKKRGEKKTEKMHIAPRKRSQSSRKLFKDLNKGVNSFLDESDADDESDVSSQGVPEVNLDMLQSNAKTNSLRPRKIRKIYTDPEESDKEEQDEKQEVVVAKRIDETKPEADIEKNADLEPGSVLIYSSKGPDGNPVYKFFMVAPVQGEQVNMENNTKNILNIGTVRVEENITAPVEENNVTIPADEEVEPSKNPNCIIQQNIVIKKAGTDTIEKTIDNNRI